MAKKQDGSGFFILIIIFIATLPFSFYLLIFGGIIYFFLKQNGKKINIKEILEKINSFNKSKNIRFSQKSIENVIFNLMKTNYNNSKPDEKILNKAIENVLNSNKINNEIQKNDILLNASKKFQYRKNNQEKQKAKQENEFLNQEITYEKKFTNSKKIIKNNKSIKNFNKTNKKSSNFKSIWDDYESVIDIMEKDKNNF